MKRFLFTLIFTMSCLFSFAQEQTFIPETQRQQQVSLDSLIIDAVDCLYYIAEQSGKIIPRYKMYKTENTYNLLKLDTATGRIWQVQYGMNKSSTKMEVPVDDTSLLWKDEEQQSGRYELYPTNNMYTFILLDTERGYTYQVQWSTNSSERFRSRIY